jgi:hypothetical protein
MKKRTSAFERWDIDPRKGPAEITERLRELAEDADPARANEIRAAWQELTLHPSKRFEAALDTRPESRVELGALPSFPRATMVREAPLELSDLLPPPRLRFRD